MARQSLESWITEAVNDPHQIHEGKAWMLTVAHMRGTTPEEILNIKFGGRSWTAKELAQLIQRKAECYAQDLPGAQQTFCVFVFYNKSTEHGAKHPFVVRGDEEINGLGSDSPDGRGVLQQGMRHTEIALGMALRHQKEVNDQLLTAFRLVGEQNAVLLKENNDAMAVVKEVMMAKAVEDAETAMALEEYKRKTGERKKLLQLAPAVINQLTGREIFPQSTADTSIIESITETLSEDQLAQLMNILKPEQAAILAPRMEKILKDRAAAAQLEAHNELDEDDASEES
jgi:hypothetical protein